MIKRGNIWLLILFGFVQNSLFSQVIDQKAARLESTLRKVELFINQEDSLDRNEIIDSFTSMIDRLEATRLKEPNDHSFLSKIFFKTHRKRLNRYSLYSDFGDTMLSGKYGCLSGTITYALILTHFGYKNEAVELSNHVYLKVYYGNTSILLESTLASSGFLDRNQDINDALERYSMGNSSGEMVAIASGNNGVLNSKIQNTIGLTELAGLQRYNRAIENHKNLKLISSLNYAIEADQFYPSLRMKYLMQLVINEILFSGELSKKAKQSALNHYISHVRENKISQTK